MIKNILSCSGILAFGLSPDAAALPENPADYQTWESSMLESIESIRQSAHPADSIEELGRWVHQLDGRSTVHVETGDRPVFFAARDLLMSIPGHAEYYERRIKEAARAVDREVALWEADKDAGWTLGPALAELQNRQMYGFGTLANLPTSETVRVLGDFMLDPWGINPMAEPGEMDYSQPERSAHAGRAMKALALLPLETRANSTSGERTKYWKDIDAWKLWYQQVKAGTRTFRFVGDPREYNLQGPVKVAVVGGPDRSGSTAGRVQDAPTAVGIAASPSESELPVWVLILSCVALVVGAWRVLRKV